MSVKLWDADYISIIGEKLVNNYIKLYITIQVNGKLKTTEQEFELIKGEGLLSYELKNWEAWEVLFSTLKDIGYDITPEDYIKEGIINAWIEEIFN